MGERWARSLGLAIALTAASGSADDVTERARKIFQTGREMYQQARYREAIAEFERAYALRPHGAIQFNIAQCHEKLGELAAAIDRYQRYLREVPGAEDRGTVELVIANLTQRQKESTPQPLTVRSAPPGAEVVLDGERRGVTPLTAEVKPGPHQVELSLPKYLKATRTVQTGWERPTEVDFILEAEPPPLTLWTRPRLYTWVALGSAATAALAGGLVGYQAQRDAAALVESNDPGRPREVVQNLRDRAARRALLANVLFGGAAVLGAGGVTLFFVEGRF